MGLREILVGQEATDPRKLWQRMYEATDYVGRCGLVMHALGGIDIALWDLKGQKEAKPIAELLGGTKWRRVPAYGTIYPLEPTPEKVREQVRQAQELNLRHFKFCADPWWLSDVAATAALLRAARAEAGPEARIIIDAALAYRTVEEGLRLVPAYQEIGIWFLEAPLPLDDLEGHARMAECGIPLGVGDLGLTNVAEFSAFMDRGGTAICQPDITMVGGFTGIERIARAALDRGKRVVTHGYKTNIEIAANLHFLANHRDLEILEYSTSRSPLRWKTTREALPVEPDGQVAVPQRPGLGVTLDWDFVNAHRAGSSKERSNQGCG
jgi:L-rhamnonate dehydratase